MASERMWRRAQVEDLLKRYYNRSDSEAEEVTERWESEVLPHAEPPVGDLDALGEARVYAADALRGDPRDETSARLAAQAQACALVSIAESLSALVGTYQDGALTHLRNIAEGVMEVTK